MKKSLSITFLAALMSVSAFAAAQFSDINPNQGAGIVMKQDSSLTLSFLRSDGTAADYNSSYPSGYNMFGYYTLDANGNILTKQQIDLSKLKDGKITIGDFKAGDHIAFWAGDGKGDYMESMHGDNEKGTTRDSAYVANNGQQTTITMGVITDNGWGPEKPMASINDNTNYIFQISSSGTIGQPLPGVTVALLIGAAVLGAIILRRKYQTKNCNNYKISH